MVLRPATQHRTQREKQATEKRERDSIGKVLSIVKKILVVKKGQGDLTALSGTHIKRDKIKRGLNLTWGHLGKREGEGGQS